MTNLSNFFLIGGLAFLALGMMGVGFFSRQRWLFVLSVPVWFVDGFFSFIKASNSTDPIFYLGFVFIIIGMIVAMWGLTTDKFNAEETVAEPTIKGGTRTYRQAMTEHEEQHLDSYGTYLEREAQKRATREEQNKNRRLFP